MKNYYNDMVVRHDSEIKIFQDTLDRKIVYHCGTSLNRIGCRTFSINLISEEKIINNFINEVEKLL